MIKITFTGDIMLQSKMISNKNYNLIFEDIKKFLEKSDFVIGNLETPISEIDSDIKNEMYCFTSPIEFAKAVKNANFDLVTVANNHCLDNGIDGIDKTIKSLEKINLDNIGLNENNKRKIYIKDFENFKVAFLSYTYGTNAFSNNVYLNKKDSYKVNLLQNQEMSNAKILKYLIQYSGKNIIIRGLKKICYILNLFQFRTEPYLRREKALKQKSQLDKEIKELKRSNCNLIIACLHIGGQYSDKPQKYTKHIVKHLQKRGVNVIICNHEHLIHNVSKENNNFVAYALGNFCSSNGVVEPPYNKMSEYSILVHMYLKNDEVTYTFSICKSIYDNKNIKVELLYNLIKNEKNKIKRDELINDNLSIVNKVLNSNYTINDIDILEEYEIK